MKAILITATMAGALAATGNALADDNGGSNPNAIEKVCTLGMKGQTEDGLAEGLKNCKRGDILDMGWVQVAVAMQLCDFTKTIVYHPPTGKVAACVYTGNRRPVSK